MIKHFIKQENGIISGKSREGTFKFQLKDILYVKALSDYVIIETTGQQHILLCTMRDLEKLLGNKFLRVHRSYIVNLDEVETYNYSKIIFKKGLISS